MQGMFLGRAFFSFHLGDAISVCPFYASRADITPSEFVRPVCGLSQPALVKAAATVPTKLRAFFSFHLRDAISVCPCYASRADVTPSEIVRPCYARGQRSPLRQWIPEYMCCAARFK